MTDDPAGESYALVIRGELGDLYGPAFEGMGVARAGGDTVLTGPVRDQSQLLGLIERIQDFGLELVSVNPVRPADREDDA